MRGERSLKNYKYGFVNSPSVREALKKNVTYYRNRLKFIGNIPSIGIDKI